MSTFVPSDELKYFQKTHKRPTSLPPPNLKWDKWATELEHAKNVLQDHLAQFASNEGTNLVVLLSPRSSNSFNPCFGVNKGKIRVLYRKDLIHQLEDKISALLADMEGFRPLYLQGPSGIGKSHLLLVYAVLMSLVPNNRVVYVSDCDAWQNAPDPWWFLVKEILVAFAKDEKALKKIIEPTLISISGTLDNNDKHDLTVHLLEEVNIQ